MRSEIRLDLEIAANEEAERRAFDGDRGLLEQAWRDAEAVASIASDLLAPPVPRDGPNPEE